jgi:tRNA-specific 2-thiouridylase
VFPVGDRAKDDVRDYARRLGLATADKPDSQDICFVADNDYASFVSKRLPDTRHDGAVVDEDGRQIARHDGVHRFTIGQRKGLGVTASPTGAPLYVLALRPADREVVVGPRSALERTTVTASDVNWIDEEPASPRRVTAQIRHRHRAAPATAKALGDRRVEVVFDEPQIAVTPGQALVLYDDDVVVGGGWID